MGAQPTSGAFFRHARVQLWPSPSVGDVSLNGFGPACVGAVLEGMTDDEWLVSLVFDARLAPAAAGLSEQSSDDRLWSSWIEAWCGIGRCRVVAQRASSSPEAAVTQTAAKR